MTDEVSREERFTRPKESAATESRGRPTGETNKGWYWLFLLPFFGTFFPWIYNTRDPELIGMPFFYWYQMLWVLLTVILTIIVYRKTKGTPR
jgi:apolipoprotein N-acyltransferase